MIQTYSVQNLEKRKRGEKVTKAREVYLCEIYGNKVYKAAMKPKQNRYSGLACANVKHGLTRGLGKIFLVTL